jgi:hypothetical protein
MQLNVISSSTHQHMVVSALTHSYYMAMTFHCMCRLSLSFIFHLHSPHHFLLFFILCAHLSHVLLSCSPVISLPSHLLASPINIPLPFPSSFCLMSEQLPYTFIFLLCIPFVLSSPFLLSTVFHFSHIFFSYIIFSFPSFPPFCYVKYSLGHL